MGKGLCDHWFCNGTLCKKGLCGHAAGKEEFCKNRLDDHSACKEELCMKGLGDEFKSIRCLPKKVPADMMANFPTKKSEAKRMVHRVLVAEKFAVLWPQDLNLSNFSAY